MDAQRRPGSRPRRHGTSTAFPIGSTPSLNEGRGRDPGDTPAGYVPLDLGFVAQRRPGSRPRRHGHGQPDNRRRWARSTKAGVETPATPPMMANIILFRISRSTKAGVETPATHGGGRRGSRDREGAQRRPGSRPRRHSSKLRSPAGGGDRSTKAGVETPATPPTWELPSGSNNALNEGRGRDPGDTRTPAEALNRTRSAQRRPGSRPRRHVLTSTGLRSITERSTKAGVETPATPLGAAPPSGWPDPAQRRPGSRPRRHC